MRISTWNVNGLRSAIKYGFENWLKENDSSIVCLQEIKMQEKILTNMCFPDFQFHWNIAERAGYSGVMTLTKPAYQPINIQHKIGDEALDKEGRVIATEFEKFILVNTYAPHSHRKLLRVAEKQRFCDRFTFFIQEMRNSQKPIIVVGDLNVAHKEIDLANFKGNKNNAGFLEFERNWMTNMLKENFYDAFRLFHDGTNHYTWWSVRKGVRERNIGWRLDYILIDQSIGHKVTNCFHSTHQLGSDHCPVTIEIDL
jgi:exodeoxyribonuclease III